MGRAGARRDRWLSLFKQGNLMLWDRTNRPVWLRCAVGVLVAIIAAAIRLQFLEILELRAPFVIFFPAVAVAALYGGFGAGLLATVVSTALAAYFWIDPVGHIAITNSVNLISMVVFLASGALISYLAEAAYRAQARAHRAEEHSRLAAEREKAAVELQQSESKYRELVENDITERKRIEEELRRLNRILRALSNTNQAAMHAEDESDFLDAVCRIIVEDCGHPMVWIGFAENDENKTVKAVAQAGFEEGYLETIKITWSDTELGRGPTGTAIRTGTPDVCRNMLTETRMAPWREQAIKRGYASSVALPLKAGVQTLGALTIYSKETGPFSDDEVKLLAELADDLAYGIAVLRLRLAHQESEKKLRENRFQLDLALRSASMGTWHWDITENRRYFDDQACYLLGIDPTMFTGAAEEFFKVLHPDDREKVMKALARTLEQDVPYETEYRAAWPDGDLHYIAARGKLIRDDEGRPVRLNGLIWDISERRHMEEELRKSRDDLELRVQERTAELGATVARLELVNAELQEFAFVASHDLQEPLRKIQTFCDMAKKRCAPVLDITGQEYLDRAINSASRMRQLLSDLLQFSRVASKREPFEKIDLVKIVREAADVFEKTVKNTGALLDIESMPAIEADESQMLRLFQNLIGNALKFRSTGIPKVKVCGKLVGRELCEILIEDNGIGFDPQFAELIFKPFQRLHNRNEYEGTGMGLAICRKIIERHGGNIRARSELGKGSTFIIRLPVKQDRWEEGV